MPARSRNKRWQEEIIRLRLLIGSRGEPMKSKTYYIPEVNAVDTFSVSSTGVFPEKIVEMDKSTFREIILDNDIRLNAWGGALWKAWDNAYENTNYAHSDNTNPIVFPAWFTFDLGETALFKAF